MNKNIPQRSCIVCRYKTDKKNLFRVVKFDNKVFVDDTYKANGRGAYICKNLECINKADKSNALERALEVDNIKSIYEELRQRIEQ